MLQTNNINANLSGDPYIPFIITDKPDRNDMVALSLESTHAAQRALSPSAFFLYMWFVLADDKQTYHFSSQSFCESFDLAKTAYNELLDNDYLTTTTRDSGTFYFHDRPLVPPYLIRWGDGDQLGKVEDEDVW